MEILILESKSDQGPHAASIDLYGGTHFCRTHLIGILNVPVIPLSSFTVQQDL